LLDAWVSAEGIDSYLHDSQWQQRPPQQQSLAAYLQVSIADNAQVSPAVLQALLEGVACGEQEHPAYEAWIGTDGRFRLGALSGAWCKAQAEFIGYAARAATRERRLGEIALALEALAEQQNACQQALAQLKADQQQAADEGRAAPSDDALRTAHAQANSAARAFHSAQQHLEQAEQQLAAVKALSELAKEVLRQAAQDLALPAEKSALIELQNKLHAFGEPIQTLKNAIEALRDAVAEEKRQQQRERQRKEDVKQAQSEAIEWQEQAAEARIRFETLRESLGADIEVLNQRIDSTKKMVKTHEQVLKTHNKQLEQATDLLARAEEKEKNAQEQCAACSAARQTASLQWQRFAKTGLLQSACPSIDLPSLETAWTVESTLTQARWVLRALADVNSQDEALWSRLSSEIFKDFSELSRSLSALSYQAQGETSDFGLVVNIIYQNRSTRPDELTLRLADEIAQRRELLNANEQQVLENHLQTEIASAIGQLLRSAEQQISAINAELTNRPTSTGVRFRLIWQPLPEGEQGAPVGLEKARKRLLNTRSELWSEQDRQVVGDMLQQRIATERSRADTEQAGSLFEQLARALDYRRWHRFRVQRWQDGQWKPLSGPASSGERALGLTVPLFAAVSSFYSHAGTRQAPRLVMLDEAFAGIDDAARAHCMALINEFDLDFVITSEREWGCYEELPGLAIAQLQRREGISAVHVSRWTWDGKQKLKRREADPDRRFPPLADDEQPS